MRKGFKTAFMIFLPKNCYSFYFPFWICYGITLFHKRDKWKFSRAIFKKGNLERGMRLTIVHKILHSEQSEDAEIIDHNSFL